MTVMVTTMLDHTVVPARQTILEVFADSSAAQDFLRIQAEERLLQLKKANPKKVYTLKEEYTLRLGINGYSIRCKNATIVDYYMEKYDVM